MQYNRDMQFNDEHRIGSDECGIVVRELQNKSIGDYHTTNLFQAAKKDCKKEEEANKKLQDFAEANYLQFKNGNGFGSHCVIDNDSKLRNGFQITKDKAKEQLFPRTFHAVANLNKGGLVSDEDGVRTDIESRVTQGEYTALRRSCDVLSEVQLFESHVKLPYMHCAVSTEQDPAHIMEPWTEGLGAIPRAGQNTRLALEECASHQYRNQ
jgi:hypothetical protein